VTDVQVLDPQTASHDLLDRVHELLAELHAEANPRQPFSSPADTRAYLRHRPTSQPICCWVVESSARVVGFATLVLVEGSPVGDARLVVAADSRRRGIGSALLHAVLGRAREAGCASVIGRHATPAGASFAARIGASDTRRWIRSYLSLADAGLQVEPVPGYRLQSWIGPAPEGLVVSYAHAREAINDDPTATEDEWDPWDVARVRDQERSVARRGLAMRVTVALDAEDGVAAFTEVRVSEALGAVANTEDTAVVRSHRGRGLARWVKAESLRLLARDRPDVTLVATTNAEENAAMRHVNERLGFVPVATHTSCVLRL
jgi:GNAT superfamily N-acetyltransferase